MPGHGFYRRCGAPANTSCNTPCLSGYQIGSADGGSRRYCGHHLPAITRPLTIGKVIDDFTAASFPGRSSTSTTTTRPTRTAEIAPHAGAIVKYEPRQGKGNVCRQMFRIDADCYLMVDGDDIYLAESARSLCGSHPRGRGRYSRRGPSIQRYHNMRSRTPAPSRLSATTSSRHDQDGYTDYGFEGTP